MISSGSRVRRSAISLTSTSNGSVPQLPQVMNPTATARGNAASVQVGLRPAEERELRHVAAEVR